MDDSQGLAPRQRWTSHLQQWGIPAHILEQAPQSPWIHPTESFRPAAQLASDTPSYLRAAEVLADVVAAEHRGGSVLDVGCGGGRASLALVPLAAVIVGVDHQASMLEVFAAEAAARGVAAHTVLGDWPDVAAEAPSCDVVVCHHVLFNVPDLVPFAEALTAHARRRVVVEIPEQHPLANLSAAWKRFWDLDRPTGPTARDAADVLLDMGLAVGFQEFELADPKARQTEAHQAEARQAEARQAEVTDRDVEHTRVRLCLPADRDAEVREFLEHLPRPPRRTVTIWWPA